MGSKNTYAVRPTPKGRSTDANNSDIALLTSGSSLAVASPPSKVTRKDSVRDGDKRVAFDVTPQTAELLDSMKDRFNQRSRVQLFELSLTILSWVDRELKAKNKVGSYREADDSFAELLLPGYRYDQ